MHKNKMKKPFLDENNEPIKMGVNENLEKLKALFPTIIKDGAVDFTALKEELGEIEEVSKERYNLTWHGKQDAKKEVQTPPLEKTLNYKENGNDNFTGDTENLYIEGDNLEVLKLLKENYKSKIKMIYIDPPYNTGKDFVYKDNFHMTQKQSDEEEGFVNEDGEKLEQRFKENTKGNRYHSNWLNMMYPRLKVAHSLLKDDGVIFISIDDNEVHNLRKLCDEIFGEENFVTNICLEITKTQGMKVKSAKEGSIVKNYEHILVYIKNSQNKKIVKNVLYDENSGYDTHFSYYINKANGKINLEKLTDKLASNGNILEEFKNIGLYKKDRISINSVEKAISVSEKIKKYIFEEIAGEIYQEMSCNIKIEDSVHEQLNKEKIVEYEGYLLTKSSGGKLRQYGSLQETLNFNDEYKSEYSRVTIRGNLWKGFYSDMMNVTKEADIEFKNGKKPKRLIKQLAKWIGVESSDIILDFFSGSATTAHAVMQLNAEDGGNRKFIMVQLQEDTRDVKKDKQGNITYKETESSKAGYKNICEIGKERIRRAGNKIVEELEEKNKKYKEDNQVELNNMLLSTEDEEENNVVVIEKDKYIKNPKALDIGFKVFEVGKTNIRWNNVENDEDYQTIEELVLNEKDRFDFNPHFTDLNVVYEIALQHRGVELSSKVENITDIGNRTYLYANSFLICLEENITENIIKKISELLPQPIMYYFRDSAFGDNISLKDDTIRTFNDLVNISYGSRKSSYTVQFI